MLKERERLEFQRDSLLTPLPNHLSLYFAFVVVNQDTGLMAADNPPQYLCFPLKALICCKHFLDEICSEGESRCKTWPWSITELDQAACGRASTSAPPAAARAPGEPGSQQSP